MNAVFLHTERHSQAALLVFVDLLFLLIALFTILLFYSSRQSAATRTAMEQAAGRILGREVELSEALDTLTPALQELMEERRVRETKSQRRAERTVQVVRYTLEPNGDLFYKGKSYMPEAFAAQVLAPLRKQHWISLRAYAPSQVSFGQVVRMRRILLRQRGEFDSYWDNIR